MNAAAERAVTLNVPRIAGLDGLRAISIALVLAGHLAGTKFCYSRAAYEQFGDLANLGVRVFFVISGYLITALLLEEYRKTGSISLGKFYIRRTLRIFPAFVVFMIAVVLLDAAGLIELFPGDLLHAATFTMNFHYERAWWVGHLWSLSVEEQFYALWPAVLLLLGVRRGVTCAAIVLAVAPIVRIAIVLWWPSQVPGIGESFPTVADTIATGCLMAGLQESLLARSWFTRLLTARVTFLAIPAAIFVLNLKAGGRLRIAALDSMINVLIALCVLRVTLASDGAMAHLLNSKSLIFVGTLSYSLYLWQQVFLNHQSDALACTFPLNLLLAVGMAIVSYSVVERPFLRLRARLARTRRDEQPGAASVLR